jgi:hypothetical protein
MVSIALATDMAAMKHMMMVYMTHRVYIFFEAEAPPQSPKSPNAIHTTTQIYGNGLQDMDNIIAITYDSVSDKLKQR